MQTDCLDDSEPPSSIKAPSTVKAPSNASLLEVPDITPEQQAEWLRQPFEDVDEAPGHSAAVKKRPAASKSSAKPKAAPKGKAKAAAKTKAKAEPKAAESSG